MNALVLALALTVGGDAHQKDTPTQKETVHQKGETPHQKGHHHCHSCRPHAHLGWRIRRWKAHRHYWSHYRHCHSCGW